MLQRLAGTALMFQVWWGLWLAIPTKVLFLLTLIAASVFVITRLRKQNLLQ
jgi:hypothetical protein